MQQLPEDLAPLGRAIAGLVTWVDVRENEVILHVDPLLLVTNNGAFKEALRQLLPNHAITLRKTGRIRLTKRKQRRKRRPSSPQQSTAEAQEHFAGSEEAQEERVPDDGLSGDYFAAD